METSQWEPREVIAFMLAPLVVPVVTGLYIGRELDSTGIFGLLIVLIATVAGYVGTLVIGLPLYVLLRKHNATAFLFAPVSGAVIGAVTMWLVWSVGDLDRLRDFWGFGALIGAAVGTVLWLIARPDLQRERRLEVLAR